MQGYESAGLPGYSRLLGVGLGRSSAFEFALPVVQGGQGQAVSLGVGSCCDCLGFDCRYVAALVLLCCHRHARFSI